MAREIVVVMLAVCLSCARASSGCDTLSCEGLEPGRKIQDPENCRSYFVCLENQLPSDSSIECPIGEYFDLSSQGCSAVKPESCRPSSHCRTRCSDAINDLISNPLDCQSFFVCLINSLVKGTCAESQYFNGSSCSSDADSCCDPCIVYCPQGGIEVYDPYDCTKYYLCEEEGVPDESHHLQCPEENPVFDWDLHRCGQGDVNCIDEATQKSISPCPKEVAFNRAW